MTERAPGGALAHPRVLLLGDPTLRPDGLERALVRGGFKLGVERDDTASPEVGPVIHSLMAVLVDGVRPVHADQSEKDVAACDLFSQHLFVVSARRDVVGIDEDVGVAELFGENLVQPVGLGL